VTAGSLIIVLEDDGDGFTQGVTGLAPGDVVNRYVVLTNTGTIEGSTVSLEVSVSGAASLIDDGLKSVTTKAITLEINSCSVAWVPATGLCSGTTTLLSSALALGSFSSPVMISSDAFDPAEVRNLQFSLSLPDQDETTVNGVLPTDTVQGKTVTITYTFSGLQRTATTVSQ
jgi:hypothetical protein